MINSLIWIVLLSINHLKTLVLIEALFEYSIRAFTVYMSVRMFIEPSVTHTTDNHSVNPLESRVNVSELHYPQPPSVLLPSMRRAKG